MKNESKFFLTIDTETGYIFGEKGTGKSLFSNNNSALKFLDSLIKGFESIGPRVSSKMKTEYIGKVRDLL